MKHKILFISYLSVALFFISQTVFALQFSIENYSGFATLSYDYSLDGKNWNWCGYLPAVTENPQSFVNLNFFRHVPISWRLEATRGKKLQCTDYTTHQPTPSIVTLKDKSLVEKDMLILDVLGENTLDKFTAQIIDLDGEEIYSNTIECTYVK
ncbi:MAG: hypothetical protein M1561_03815 [Gammaproteobacteria bacterium]|nr:hypothetical protein [Gammaproteobacteria bacterium]